MKLISVFHKSLYFTMGNRIFIILTLVAGMVSCARLPDITSESIRKVSREFFIKIDWSPDGSSLIAIGSRGHPGGDAHLYSVEVATGFSTKLTEAPKYYDFPAWSPNGDKVALTVDQNTIWVFDVVSRDATFLTTGEGAVWYSEGDRLAVYVGPLSNKGAEQREIRIVGLEGNILHTHQVGAVIPELFQLQTYLNHPVEYLAGFDMSPDGDKYIFSLLIFSGELIGDDQSSQRYESYMVDLRDNNVVPFLPGDTIGHVSWAPDGRKIAYIRPDTLDTGQLVIAIIDGECLLIPELPAEIRSPTWSKDGSRLAFLYGGRIHIMDIDLQRKLQGSSGCP